MPSSDLQELGPKKAGHPELQRLVGAWPADACQALVIQLELRIEQTSDPVEKTRLQKLRDAVEDVGAKVVSELIIKAATGVLVA